MKELGNLIIVVGVIIIITSIVIGIKHSNTLNESCVQKGGMMVKGKNGWICVKLENVEKL